MKKNRFPTDLNNLYLPFHIVREADLLTSYDFSRGIIYKLYQLENNNNNINNLIDSYEDTIKLFNSRVFKHNDDNLFITNAGKELSKELEINTINDINNWNDVLFKK